MYMPNIAQGLGLEIVLLTEIGYIWFQSLRNRNTETLSAFFNLCSALMLFLLINIPVRISDLQLVRWDPFTVFILNALFIAFETLTAYEWFVYFLTVQESDFFKRKAARFWLPIPLVLMLLLLVASYKTHWLFYVTEEGIYVRGSLFFLQLLLPFCYLLASFISTLIVYRKKKNRRMLKILRSAFLGAAAAAVLQVLFSGSFSHAGLSLVVTLAYIEIYQHEIEQMDTMRSLSVVNEQLEQANRKLNDTVAELEISIANEKAANNAKNEFLSRMSHDIRTPLNGILGILEINDRFPNDVELLAENRKKARTAAGHLLSLVNDVLDMSKLSSGTYEISREPFVMSRLVEDVFTITAPSAEQKKVRLINENEQDDFAYPVTYGSPLHITRILLNIIGNAIKFNRQDGCVRVRLDHEAPENDHIRYILTISDTGIGMSEQYIETLFEPFSRERTNAGSVYEGVGLGMAIAKALVEKMGGTISAESAEGVGSKFVISVPFEIAESEGIPTAASADDRLDGYRVLLVEDNELNIDIAQTLLEDSGAEVEVAENGKLAVETFESRPEGTFDVILMDCMMPVMDGYEATQAIRQLNRPDAVTIPIIAMSANAFSDDVRKCIMVGMNDHLPKPFDIDKVIAAVRQYAGRDARRS